MSSPRVLPRIVEREIACKENRVTRLCHFKMDVCKNTRCSVTGARGGLSTTDSIIQGLHGLSRVNSWGRSHIVFNNISVHYALKFQSV